LRGGSDEGVSGSLYAVEVSSCVFEPIRSSLLRSALSFDVGIFARYFPRSRRKPSSEELVLLISDGVGVALSESGVVGRSVVQICTGASPATSSFNESEIYLVLRASASSIGSLNPRSGGAWIGFASLRFEMRIGVVILEESECYAGRGKHRMSSCIREDLSGAGKRGDSHM
jgi:hypothetical protein